MQMHEVDEVKEVIGVGEVNQALAHGWRLVTVVPRGATVAYVLGREVASDEAQGKYVRGRWVPKE
ncbi:hypothetical protein JJD66_23770 [Pseudomonas sp. MF6751]|uniref:hypothetical protein n=1 Tax=Pseudomonas sp. MF6751 TaxID=2797528 RepID=UPI00190C139A|nr:hypothetical protein [Pseudomonas sp. MF6751]MBK3479104.1 hypothetical protein [Pseudomonas sp. MF6751]